MASETLFVNSPYHEANSRSLSPGSGSSTQTSKSNTPTPFSPPSTSPSLFYREPPTSVPLSSLPPHPSMVASASVKSKPKPKLPRSAYTFYVSHQRTGVRLLSGSTSSPASDSIEEDLSSESGQFAASSPKSQTKHRHAFRVAAEEVGKKWREMSAEEKAPFIEMAKQDKERYVRETLENLSEQLKSSGAPNVSPQQMEMLNAARAGRSKDRDAK